MAGLRGFPWPVLKLLCYTEGLESAMDACILVVEDEPLAAMELKENLEALGYRVPETLASGDEVLSAVLRLKPDLVIMDIHLKSYIDGVDAVSRLRLVSTVPVIYITAYPAESVEERVRHTMPVDYLVKPIDDERLRESIERALADGPARDSRTGLPGSLLR
jgi:CheY-like chemotaxis protein